MNSEEMEWDALAEVWQEEESPATPDFGTVLRRRRAATTVAVLGEVIVTAGLVWLTARLADPATVGSHTILLAGTWLFWAVATLFAWWNRRGQWSVSVASPHDFLRLSLVRAERKIRLAWFCGGLMAAQVAFVMTLVASGRVGPQPPDVTDVLITLAALVGVYSTWAVWYGRRAYREREHFAALLRADDEGGTDPAR